MQPEPKQEPEDLLEVAVDAAIAICDGDMRAALRASLVYNEFLERKIEMMREQISAGYTRGRITPGQAAADRWQQWNEIASGIDTKDSEKERLLSHGVGRTRRPSSP